jgi:competence protein ComEC
MKIDFSNSKLFTVFIAIFYISGLLGSFLNHKILYCFIAFLALAFLTFFSNLNYKRLIVLYLIFFLGIIRAGNAGEYKDYYINDVELSGKIITSGDINLKNQKIKFYIKEQGEFLKNEKILISLDLNENIKDKIKIGNYIKLKGKLRTPKPNTNPYQFDYKNYLSNNDCHYILYGENSTLFVTNTAKFGKNIDDSWYYILAKFEKTRNDIIKTHAKNIKSPNLEILGGLVFGNETINPDEEIKESFKSAGLLHLLAASGLNVALIFGIWFWIANLFRLPYNFSIISGCVFIIFYTFMTGFPPSILRASLMILFVLLGKLIDRNTHSVALLFFVGFLILLFQPKMIFDIGFQLSFAVTFGLITGVDIIISKFKDIDEKFKNKYKNLNRFQKYFLFLFSPMSLISIISVPLMAQLWVIPLQMHYFNNFAPLSVLANIAVVPFIGILSFIGFISSIFALVPFLNNFMVYIFDIIANPLLTLLVKISTLFSGFEYSLIPTISLNIFQIFNFWLIILLVLLNLKNNFKNKKHIVVLSFAVLIFSVSFIKPSYFSKNLEIVMFDVANADSFLIKTPKSEYFIIDTGKKSYKGYSDGEAIINKYLKNERILKINTLILTHYDLDHIGGALDILENNKVENIIVQHLNPDTFTSKQIIDYLKENKLNYKIVSDEIIYSEPDLKIRTLNAPIDDENEASIITIINYKNKNYLFMADAGILAYEKIKNKIPEIEILKVGHHGAKDVISNTMLKNLNPKYALISTGINKYGHPDIETINLLYENNIKTISTRNYGFTKILIDDEIKFYHFNKLSKKIEQILFNMENSTPFHKSKYVQNLIKSNM